MAKGVRCIECGYRFGFSNQGMNLANAEYDPEVLRQMKAGQLDQIDPKDQTTFRNYTLKDWGFPPGGTTIGPHIWNQCSYIGCYRRQFPNAVNVESRKTSGVPLER